ncbi:MAG: DNA polymerase I [Deltaproteobacteria bacterium]|nr:DNA polymerase I [Deltaproteobacteria bacterium]
MKKTLFIIDGSSCIYRAYHAVPRFTTSKGLPTNAIYGFTQTLRKLIKTYSPDYIGIAFDVKGPTLRHALFEEYKVQRPPMPDELVVQIPFIKEISRAFNIILLEREGFEADDIIATLVKKFKEEGLKLVMVTGDKDMLQLVSGIDVVVLDYAKEKEIGENEVKEKFGVAPALMADLIGLAGDASDNIPGVHGIGVKTAAKLINRFGSIDEIFKRLGEVSPERLRKSLEGHKDDALLSRKLATLHDDIPFTFDVSSFKMTEPDLPALEGVLRELEFTKFIRELRTVTAGSAKEVNAVLTEAAIRGLLEGFSEEGEFISVILERRDRGWGAAAGCGLSSKRRGPHSIPLDNGVKEEVFLKHIKGTMEDASVKKATDDAKGLFIYFVSRGIEPKGVEMDVAVASYLLNPTRSSHNLADVAYHYLGKVVAKDGGMDERAGAVLELTPVLLERLRGEGIEKLFYGMEMALTRVLADMELKGVMVDKSKLKDLSSEMESKLKSIEEDIYRAAGYSFNINSPKQVSELLFTRLGLKPVKKTKTGYSTDENVLAALGAAHEIPCAIMNFRFLSKLKGTYVDSLLLLADPKSCRIHTSFNQTVTATGRLSSSGPNLQNIPAKGEYAGRIRGCFIAPEGHKFISADYSQIELRVVAHFSQDPALIDAFNRDEDIHAMTASGIFAVPLGLVTHEMRRRAKAINFGIIYGMGEHGLSSELGLTFKEARDYMDAYFLRYGKVKEFMDMAVREAKEKGYSETLFGRRRPIPELRSPSPHVARLGERIAINTPIQGTAADIIKEAMIGVAKRLTQGIFKSRMILQIHDELILEVPEEELDIVKAIVKEEMEGVVTLKVPLRVNMGVGGNWQEAG